MSDDKSLPAVLGGGAAGLAFFVCGPLALISSRGRAWIGLGWPLLMGAFVFCASALIEAAFRGRRDSPYRVPLHLSALAGAFIGGAVTVFFGLLETLGGRTIPRENAVGAWIGVSVFIALALGAAANAAVLVVRAARSASRWMTKAK